MADGLGPESDHSRERVLVDPGGAGQKTRLPDRTRCGRLFGLDALARVAACSRSTREGIGSHPVRPRHGPTFVRNRPNQSGGTMNLKDRIGIDLGRRIRLEEGIEWAARNGVRYIDIQLDTATNAITTFDDARAAAVHAACERYGIYLGLHTLSAVNVAEYSPYVSEAMDQYLRSYVDIYPKLGARWIVRSE